MITSTSNPQIKQVVNLQAKGKVRSELGLFVVEGRKMVEEVPESLCRKVFVSESYLESQKNRNFLINSRWKRFQMLCSGICPIQRRRRGFLQ